MVVLVKEINLTVKGFPTVFALILFATHPHHQATETIKQFVIIPVC